MADDNGTNLTTTSIDTENHTESTDGVIKNENITTSPANTATTAKDDGKNTTGNVNKTNATAITPQNTSMEVTDTTGSIQNATSLFPTSENDTSTSTGKSAGSSNFPKATTQDEGPKHGTTRIPSTTFPKRNCTTSDIMFLVYVVKKSKSLQNETSRNVQNDMFQVTLDDMKNSTVDPKVTKVPDENKNTKNSSVKTIENTSSKTITQNNPMNDTTAEKEEGNVTLPSSAISDNSGITKIGNTVMSTQANSNDTVLKPELLAGLTWPNRILRK